MSAESLTGFLLRLFRIRKGEVEKTFLMFLFAFNWVAAFLVGRVMKDTLFLSKNDLDWLPWMYIIVAAVVPASLVFSRVVGKLSLQVVGNVTLIGIMVMLGVFRLLLPNADPDWVIPALYVFIEIMGVLLMIIFWSFANELFNSREAKRLFGVIAGGLVVANFYGFPLRALKDDIGIYNLAFVCMVSVAICLVIFNHLATRYRLNTLQRGRRLSRHDKRSAQALARTGIFGSLRRHIVLVTGITMLTVTFVDYQFKVMASHYHAENMAEFFFSVYAYTGIFACIIQFFITGRILEKFGILAALMILPLTLLAGSTLSIAFLGYVGVTLTKGGELVTRYTITETATQLFYQPLPAPLRRQTKALSDGVMRPAAMALAGACFILINHFVPISDQRHFQLFSWVIILAVAGWLILLVSTRRRYVEALLVSGDHRAHSTGSELEEDERTLAISRLVIQRTLAGDDEAQILNALEVLPLTRWAEWDEHVQPLLKSPYPRVQQRAVAFLGRTGNRKYSRRIAELFAHEDARVRAAAIREYSKLERERAVGIITRFLKEDSPLVKAAAITSLITHGGLDGILSSTAELKKMLETDDARERESGARVLGYVQIKSFFQPLFKLIHDPVPSVRLAAIEAAGRMRAMQLVPNLIYLLQDTEMHNAAARALAGYGEQVLDPLNEVLTLNHLSPKIRQSIPAILAQIESPRAYDMLEPLLQTRDARLRSAVMRAMQKLLSRMEHDITPDIIGVQRALHAELQSYYQLLVFEQILLDNVPMADLLISSLHDRAREATERIFYLLGIIYPREQIEIVSYNLRSDNPAMRANAIEIVDNICESETRRYLLPLLDTLPLEDKVAAGRRLFQLMEPDPKTLFRYLLWSSGDEWLAACAIHVIGAARLSPLKDDVLAFADHENPVIREAVIFTMHKLADARNFVLFGGQYISERDAIVKGYLNYLVEEVEATA